MEMEEEKVRKKVLENKRVKSTALFYGRENVSIDRLAGRYRVWDAMPQRIWRDVTSRCLFVPEVNEEK